VHVRALRCTLIVALALMLVACDVCQAQLARATGKSGFAAAASSRLRRQGVPRARGLNLR
jgi:hypothetical protein